VKHKDLPLVTYEKPKHPVIETTVPLDVFERFVNECARLRLDQPIANSCPFHARLIIAKLFELAKREICLVSEALTACTESGVELYAYRPIIENMNRFLRDPNAVLSIIIQSGHIEGKESNEFLREVINATTRNGTVLVHLPEPGVLSDRVHHFIVVDEAMIRSESSDAPRDRDEPIGALANFGNLKDASDLKALYTELLKYLDKNAPRVRKFKYPRGAEFTLR